MIIKSNIFYGYIQLAIFVVAMGFATSCHTTKTIDNIDDLANLLKKTASEHKVMFGHQDDTAYGHDWCGEDGRSDVYSVCGDYPAIIGWDLGKIEHNDSVNIDGIPFTRMKSLILEQYYRGGINTISWHHDNPVSGKDSWDRTDTLTIHKILTNKDIFDVYLKWLDNVAEFISSLKNENGEMVPIIFRPLHENTGNWFWWGAHNCTAADYKKLWKTTVEYLKDKKGLTNLLYTYSPSTGLSEKEFYERYPGDNYVDIIGVDCYYLDSSQSLDEYKSELNNMLKIISKVGKERNKPIAITETGNESVKIKDWWTNTILKFAESYPISYVLVWRNAHDKPAHYYGPCPENASCKDFIKFYRNRSTIFSRDIPKL